MSQDLVLQVRDLNVWYRPSGTIGRRKRRQVLHDVSFDLHRGEILGLVGESGSGKTTLARTILGFVPDYTGTVTHFTKRPQMVFQDPASSLNPSCTVGWILAEPLRIYGKYDREEIRRRVDEALKLVGMYEYRDHAPHLLSGGQKQRIAIAGVIAMRPRCIVLDEPTAMLDPHGREEVISTIERLNREMGITVVLITHHMTEAIRAQRVIVMDAGRILADGTPKEVFPQVELLESVGLTVPATTKVLYALNQAGFDLPLDALSTEECAQVLLAAIRAKT